MEFTASIRVLSFILASVPAVSLAQGGGLPPYQGAQGALRVWNSNITWADHGMFFYEFTVDSQGMVNTDANEISNLVIESDFGNIEFQGTLTGGGAGRYGTGRLLSQSDGDTATLTRATAEIGGKRYDVSGMVSMEQFKPLVLVPAMRFNGVFGDSYLRIWHIDTGYDTNGTGNKIYTFMVDPGSFLDLDFSLLEDLKVTTSAGDIVFPGQRIAKPGATGPLTGALATAETLGQLKIYNATAKINGVSFSFAGNLILNRFSPLAVIDIVTPGSEKCPTEIKDLSVYEGVFGSLAGDDDVLAGITVNGEDEYYRYDDSVGYFFENEQNSGKKVKIAVEKRQYYEPHHSGDLVFYECNPSYEIITKVVPAG
jgi:hypothetical protein